MSIENVIAPPGWVDLAGRGKKPGKPDPDQGAQTEGLRVRLSRVRGLTDKGLLKRPLRIPAWWSSEFAPERTAAFEDFGTVSAGEYSSPVNGRGKRARSLRGVSGDAIAMIWDPSWMVYPGQHPSNLRDDLFKVLDAKSPFDLLVTRGGMERRSGKLTRRRPELHMVATLRAVTPRLVHGENDTLYFALEFREFRDMGFKRRGRGDEKLPTKHKLKAEDTLRKLARRYYGKEPLWQHIAKANKIRNWGGNDPLVEMKRFKPGDSIRIPKKPGKDDDKRAAELGSDDPDGVGVGAEL